MKTLIAEILTGISDPFDFLSFTLQGVTSTVKVTFLLVKKFLMMLGCHVQIVSLQRGFKIQPLPLDLCIQLHVMFLQQGKNAGTGTKCFCPLNMQKKNNCLYKYNTGADWLEPAYPNELKILFAEDICQGRSEVRKCS